MYMETRGGLQLFASPVDYYWYYYVSSYYGYRKNPNTGASELHRGLDISVPTGSTVYAGHDGTVTEAAYDSYYGNYVVITDDKGYTTKYAHMDSLNVSQGTSVTKKTVIGTSGNTGSSTGSHLHIECLYNGEYYNPLFYFNVGSETIYGETSGGMSGDVIPPDSYDDATVRALLTEANRYLGMPYTFGGTAPASFDCSGFVCWVFSNSGVHDLPRTTAQGIYDQCTPVSASEAKAGDIIFFTGTYNAGRPVTHVGIYCGNGVMVHCGDPIQYTSINTAYWQSHFYGFGRLN
jgi:cell wall-associated NlpC family hydrolase